MTESTPGQTKEGLIHVESFNEHIEVTQEAFEALVQKFLRRAPNTEADGLRLNTAYWGEYPTHKNVSFKLGASTVTVDYNVALGTPPTSKISVNTPIIVDNLPPNRNSHHPNDPFEYAEFNSNPYDGVLSVSVGARTRPGDFGRPILLGEYTAGGLLPSLHTEGKGKLEAFDSVVAVLKDVRPQNPTYAQPQQPASVR